MKPLRYEQALSYGMAWVLVAPHFPPWTCLMLARDSCNFNLQVQHDCLLGVDLAGSACRASEQPVPVAAMYLVSANYTPLQAIRITLGGPDINF